MIQDKIFFDEKDPTGLSYNTPFTYYGSYQGRLWSKSPSGSIQYYTQNSDLSAYATTGSNQFSGSQTVTGSLTVTGGITGTATTASYVEYANVANRPTLVSGSSQVTYSGLTGIPSGIVSGSAQIASFGIFATTGSNGFNGSQSITGSLTVTGQVVAQTLNVQQVTSSIVFSSGSNIFGNSLANTQQFTGSLQVTGSSHNISGNLGLGITPSAWVDYRVLQLGGGSISSYVDNNFFEVNQNAFWNGSSYRYVNNGFASRYQQTVGRHEWYQAASGTAGNAISFTQAMTLNASGRLLLGTTDDNGARLQVSGGNITATNNLVFNRPSTSAGNNIEWRTASTLNWYIGTRGLVDNNFYFVNEALGVNNLILNASTGAATFSSSVTATQYFAQSNTAYYAIKRAAGTDVGYITDSGTWGDSGTDFTIGASSANLRFYVNNNTIERMRIFSDGNVFIGSSPSNNGARLQVSGAATFSSSVTAGGTIVASLDQGSNNQFFNLTGTQSGFAQTYSFGIVGSSRDFRIFDITANQQRLTITSGGNVGIGTNNPATTLEVRGSGNTTLNSKGNLFVSSGGTASQTAGAGGQISFGAWLNGDLSAPYPLAVIKGVSESSTTNFNNGSLIFGTMDANTAVQERMRITSGGNVGIGTTSPGSRLTVDGGDIKLNAANAAASYYLNLNRTSGQDGHIIIQTNNTNDWQIASDNTGNTRNLFFYSYGINNFVMTLQRATGNVLIGTTTDSGARLTVGGSVRADSFNTSTKTSIEQNSGTVPANTATTVFTRHGGGNGGAFVLVTGRTAAGNWFFDTVAFLNDNAATAISSQNGGSPPSRSYSVSGQNLRLTVSTALDNFSAFGLSVIYN